MSESLRKFKTAAEFNEYAMKEIIKNRTLAILSRGSKKQIHERAAGFWEMALNLLNSVHERRMLTSDGVAISRSTSRKSDNGKPEEHKDEGINIADLTAILQERLNKDGVE